MKNISSIPNLIRIHLLGTPTPEDKSQLNKWLSESEDNVILYQQIQAAWREKSAEPKLVNTDELADKIWDKAMNGPVKRKVYPEVWQNWVKIAAVIVLLIVAAITLYITPFSSTEIDTVSSQDIIIKTNPSGQKSRFSLPDGSVVWLNSESSLRYSIGGFDSVRRVELTGEGFFDVVKDSLRRFEVISAGLNTTALGTSFNVQAYSSDTLVEVALLEGNVMIGKGGMPDEMLEPGRALAYDRYAGMVKKFIFDRDRTLGWKDGILVFKGASLEEFVQRTERWYGVEIEVRGSPAEQWSLSGHYENVPLDYLLDDVKFSTEFNFEIQKNKVNITF